VSKVEVSNAKIKRAFGIRDVKWVDSHGKIAVWLVTFHDRDSLTVELPAFGTTESSVLRQVVDLLSASQKVRMA
jgi:hypothetical protein